MSFFALFGPIGLPEMLIILVIILLIFGASRLPEIGKGVGHGNQEFQSVSQQGARGRGSQAVLTAAGFSFASVGGQVPGPPEFTARFAFRQRAV